MARAVGKLKETKEKLDCQDFEAAPASPPEAPPGRSYRSAFTAKMKHMLVLISIYSNSAKKTFYFSPTGISPLRMRG